MTRGETRSTANSRVHSHQTQCANSFCQCVARMKNLPLKLLLTSLALVCGIYCQTQPQCNPMKRMKTVPSYKTITGKPKKVIDSSGPIGICVAESGIFAVLSYNPQLYFHMYYESGELMKAVRGPHAEPVGLGFCTFSGDYLFLTDLQYHLHQYSINGTYIKLFTRRLSIPIHHIMWRQAVC